jgi:XTP/dITP diphosphohydrolase
MRKFEGDSLLIATHNPGKAREIGALLKPYVARFVTAAEMDLPEPEETGATFIENAALKARAVAIASGLPALADDSGLCVNALNGDPGIYSARWAGPGKDFQLAMQKVHQALGESLDRSAYFVCVLSLAWPDGHVENFEGRIDGDLVWPPRGNRGFGYDPIFIAKGYTQSFAEIDPDHKHAISHRAKAFENLVKSCF